MRSRGALAENTTCAGRQAQVGGKVDVDGEGKTSAGADLLTDFDADHPHDECAVFGIFAPGLDVSRLAYFGLHALQHRGQESAGIAVADGFSVSVHKDMGLVTQVFDEDKLAALKGHIAVGHTRYSTVGGSTSWESAQPHLSSIGDDGIIALAHNGTLVNSDRLRITLLDLGVPFRSSTDSEVAAKLIAHYTVQTSHLREGIGKAMELMEGAYSMVLSSSTSLYAFRDPYGFRPLSIGRLPHDAGWVVASETCAFDIVGAEFVRDVEPGEVIRINEEGLVIEQAVPPRDRALCIFEFCYIARPDSTIDGMSVYRARKNMGHVLAREAPAKADLVVAVPDSGVPAAVGFAEESGIPYGDGLIKNRYVGRTFIQPTQAMRERGVRMKLNPLPLVIKDKRLVLVDDSIVRGTTSKQIVQMLRDAGAAEVHMRIVSPPDVWPCFYGIDTGSQEQLIASRMDVEGIRAFIGADSLEYISLEGLKESVAVEHPGFCAACFDGCYPVKTPDAKMQSAFSEGMVPTWREG